MDWTVQESNPGGARNSAPVQTGPVAHPDSCAVGTGSVSWEKSGRVVDLTPTPSSAEVQERVKLHIYSPYKPSWPVIG